MSARGAGGAAESPPPYRLPEGGPVVAAIATMDLGLRTLVASLVCASAGPAMIARGSRSADRGALDFYAGLAEDGDVERVFQAPPRSVRVKRTPVGRLSWAPRVGRAETLSFVSPYRVSYPRLREAYLAHKPNATAWAQHWRHDDGARPTIIAVHGFMGSPYWFNSSFFALPWFYDHGCDVVLVTLPFHGRRNDRFGPFSGSGLFANGFGHFNEAMLQSVCDLRVVVGHLARLGVEHIGITGLSLGGYLAALLAAVERRLYLAIPNAAVTDLARLIDSWYPAGQLINAGLRQLGVDRGLYEAALSVHSPLHYPPALPASRLFVIGGLGDRLAPPEQSAMLWEHWGRPRLHWYPGSHILHLGRSRYLRQVGRFLRDSGFSPG